MKQHWDNLINQIQTLIDSDAAVINGLRNSTDVSKIKKTFQKNVKTLSKLVEEFAVFVPDPEADEVQLPFDSTEFVESWNDYKEFLLGVYGIVLIPVEEKRRLKKLYRLSSKNEKTALDIIDLLINSRYRNINSTILLQLSDDKPGNEAETESNFTIKKNTI